MYEFSITAAGFDRYGLHFFHFQQTQYLWHILPPNSCRNLTHCEFWITLGRFSTTVTRFPAWYSHPWGKLGPVTRALPFPFLRSQEEQPKLKWQFLGWQVPLADPFLQEALYIQQLSKSSEQPCEVSFIAEKIGSEGLCDMPKDTQQEWCCWDQTLLSLSCSLRDTCHFNMLLPTYWNARSRLADILWE